MRQATSKTWNIFFMWKSNVDPTGDCYISGDIAPSPINEPVEIERGPYGGLLHHGVLLR